MDLLIFVIGFFYLFLDLNKLKFQQINKYEKSAFNIQRFVCFNF